MQSTYARKLFPFILSAAGAVAALPNTGCVPENRPDASSRLISAFRGSCGTSGRWSDAAVAHNEALIGILTELRDNDPCKPFAATLGNISSMSAQIQGLLSNTAYTDYRQAEENLQELTLALQGAAPGSDLATGLGSAIVQAQVDLAGKRAASTVATENADRDRFAQSTQQLASTMQGLLQQTDGLAGCLRHSPSAAVGLATNLLAIGGNFISPVLGAGVSVVGQLLNIAVEAARTAGTDAAIWKLHSAELPLALNCGLESMTELYCGANDAFDLLDLQAASYPEPGAESRPVWRGLDLIGRRLPVLNQWLLGLRNGVRPADPLEAERQNIVWKRVAKIDEYYRNIYAGLKYAEQLYDGAGNQPSIQQDVLLKAIKNLSVYLAGGSSAIGAASSDPNPFSDRSNNPDNYACWLVLGPEAACPDHSGLNGSTASLYGEDYIKFKLLAQASMAGLFAQWEAIYTGVKAQVDLEFAQTVTADPRSLLSSAREAASDNISPREVISLIQSFLTDLLAADDGTNPQKPALLRETLAMFADATKILDRGGDEPGPAPAPGDGPLDQVRRLFDAFQLRHGLQFVNDRVSNFVQWDIQARLRRGELPGDALEILRSAGGDIRSRLLASGVTHLQEVSGDLNSARQITERNISVFRAYFAHSIGKSVQALHDAAQEAGEPATGPNRPNGQTLAELCTLTLATGAEWPKHVSWEICSQAVLSSVYPDPKGILSIRLADLRADLEGQPYQMRMCAYHRFLRAGRLAEVLGPPAAPAPNPKKLGNFLEIPGGEWVGAPYLTWEHFVTKLFDMAGGRG